MYSCSCGISSLFFPSDALVRQMLPLGYTKSEIRQQLFLNSNHHTSEGHMPAGQEKGKWEVEEGQNGGEKMEDSGKEETGQKFTVGKIEVSTNSIVNVLTMSFFSLFEAVHRECECVSD